MIYFSRKSDDFQDFIKFWGFVETKKYEKSVFFQLNEVNGSLFGLKNYSFFPKSVIFMIFGQIEVFH